MATFIKGDAVANATSYELLEKTAEGEYLPLAENAEINFALEDLRLAGGNHTLVVTAKADGFETSDYSNEVVYSVPMGAYWIGEKLSGGTIGTGTPTSMLNTQYFYIDDAAYIAELSGKTIEAIAFGTGSKEVTGNIILALVDRNNTLPTAWEEKATIAVTNTADTLNTIMTVELETPFTIPEGYTLGYRTSKGNILGGGEIISGYKRDDKYYSNNTATEATSIKLGSFDCKVK